MKGDEAVFPVTTSLGTLVKSCIVVYNVMVVRVRK